MLPKIIDTKFGKAHLVSSGYYVVRKDNTTKLLHRLEYEDHHKLCLLDGVVLHHIDGNKWNNELDNLMPMFLEDHTSLHMQDFNPMKGKHHTETTKKRLKQLATGRTHTDEVKHRISMMNNTTGYFRVIKNIDKRCKNGFTWVYQYYKEGKQKRISSVNLDKLKEKVLAQGLEWREI